MKDASPDLVMKSVVSTRELDESPAAAMQATAYGPVIIADDGGEPAYVVLTIGDDDRLIGEASD